MLSLTHRKLVTDLNKSISRGVFKQKPQVTKNPESINHRVYWWSEHRPYRRTVLDICRIITHTRSFHSLINPQSLIGSELVHKLSLPGPFTGFIPVNSAISQSIKGLDDRSLSNFILSHFVSEYYLHRDIIGSTQSVFNTSFIQNLACSNEIRQKITSLDNLSGQTLEFVRDVNEIGETIIRVNNAEVLRWNLKCHNGVIHIINNTLV